LRSRSRSLLSLCLLTACPGDVAQTTDPATTTSADTTNTTSPGNSETGGDPPTTGADTTTTTTPASTTTANLDDSGAPDTTTTGDTDTSDTTSTTGAPDTSTGDPPLCGNGELDPGELCDDADADETDECLADCTPGPAGAPVPLPPFMADEYLECLTAAGDGLMLGSRLSLDAQMWSHVQQIPLPEGDPVGWSHVETAGIYGRRPMEAATAANGDVIVGGLVWTEQVQVDSGGYLWLARFTAAGELVWNVERIDLGFGPSDLEVSPNGDIVLVGRSWGFIAPISTVAVFDAAGQLEWFVYEEVPDHIKNYAGVAIDGDGQIYAGGTRYGFDAEWQDIDYRLLVRAFTPGGASLWEYMSEPSDPVHRWTSDIVLTTDDQLVLAARRYDPETSESLPTMTLAALDTAGNPLWSKEWSAPTATPARPGVLLATDDGGFYLSGGAGPTWQGDETLLAHLDAAGDPVWIRISDGAGAIDLTRGPDNLLYLLTSATVVAHAP